MRRIIGIAVGLGVSVFADQADLAAAGPRPARVDVAFAGSERASPASRLADLFPRPPAGWTAEGEPESMSVPGMDQLEQQYVRVNGKPGALTVMFVKLTRAPQQGAGAGPARGAPDAIDINGLKANLVFDAAQRGGTLSFNAGHHSVVVVGDDVTRDELLALARQIDTKSLVKI